MGVRQTDLGAMKESRRAKSAFPSADACLLDGQRQENIRVAQDIVVEEVARPRAEAVHIQDPAVKRPAVKGYGQAEFVLFVALSVQGQKAEPLLKSEIEQRAGHGRSEERRVGKECRSRRGA